MKGKLANIVYTKRVKIIKSWLKAKQTMIELLKLNLKNMMKFLIN